MVYLDNAATTKLDEKVFEEMKTILSCDLGNPSSINKYGRNYKIIIENARKNIARLLSCKQNELYFTSGGTESNNMIIKGIAFSNLSIKNKILYSSIEHPSVSNTCEYLKKFGFNVKKIKVNTKGQLDLDELSRNLDENTLLCSVMHVNNDVGFIQDIQEISKICHKNNVYFHTDTVQSIASMPINIEKLDVDALSLSAHKFYGPKGIGLAYIKEGIAFDELISGGGQEHNKRSSTENVASIVGMNQALIQIYENYDINQKKYRSFKNKIISELVDNKNVYLNGNIADTAANQINLYFSKYRANVILPRLDMKNIIVSAGSACHSGSAIYNTTILEVFADKKRAESSIRISFSKYNTIDEIDKLISELKQFV